MSGLVTINTDTVFDEEGVPVSIRCGAKGVIIQEDETMVQVLIWWKDEGPEILGVPRQYIAYEEIP